MDEMGRDVWFGLHEYSSIDRLGPAHDGAWDGNR